MTAPRTLYRKIVDSHTVRAIDDRANLLLYVDRQVLNEYTSPQAFAALRDASRRVWRPKGSLAVVDHVNPTTPLRVAGAISITDAAKARQVSTLGENCRRFGIEFFDILDKRQGIEHIVATEQGFVLPGMVIAAGDSHTTTHGALGSLSFGIGTSEIEHLLATQTDDRVFDYLSATPRAPKGALWDQAIARWRTLKSDDDAAFDCEMSLDATRIEPMVTWGTSPDQAVAIGGVIPDPSREPDPARRRDMERALDYMALQPGTRVDDVRIDRAFIGSCTNGRIEDLRDAAQVLRGRRISAGVRGMVVPGSTAVHDEAEREGLDRIFLDAGFEWRQSGCSMCVAMNDDHLRPGERCASSTNRNFEGRQGAGGRTHLMSPAMVAAAAIAGRLTDVRRLEDRD